MPGHNGASVPSDGAVPAPMIAVILGAGAFGALLGAWIVLSASPVVTTSLPLLFGLVGGAGGVQLFRFDPGSAKSRTRLVLFGVCTASFSAACFAGMLIAAELRPWLTRLFHPPLERVEVLGLISDTPFRDKPFEALLLAVRLKDIGATRDEIQAILKEPQVAEEFSLQSSAGQTASGIPANKPPTSDRSNRLLDLLKSRDGAQRGPVGPPIANEIYPFSDPPT